MPRRPRVWEGMSSDALHPAVPALTWVPPLSQPGLVAAWPDSPGLLPRPRLPPSQGRGLLQEGHCAAQVRGSGDRWRAAGWGLCCWAGQRSVGEQRVCLCVRGWCRVLGEPRYVWGTSQPAFVQQSSLLSMQWVCGRVSVCLLSPAGCLGSQQLAQGLCGLVTSAVEPDRDEWGTPF